MLARICLFSALLFTLAARADVLSRDNVLASHGLDFTWNGIPMAGIGALEETCHKEAKRAVRSKLTVVFDYSTPIAQMKRIVNVFRGKCGASNILVTFSSSKPPQSGR